MVNFVEGPRDSTENRPMKNLLTVALLAALSVNHFAQEAAQPRFQQRLNRVVARGDSGNEAGAEVTTAAKALLASLSAEQVATAKFDLTNGERFNWHFIPKERKGLSMKEMTPAQDLLAFG